MTSRRVSFLSDREEAPEIDRDLLGTYRSEIEQQICEHWSSDAETVALKGGGIAFLTSIPKPRIGRIMARWIEINDEEALVTGVRSGEQSYETPD